MKVTFLGCGAYEGIPALFCECKLCKQSRERKIFRTRSQLLIDDNLLIDFPPDSYYRALQMGVDLGKIENILITHSHSDHFYSEDFFARGLWSSFCLPKETLTLHGSAVVRDIFEKNGCARQKGLYRHESTGMLNGYQTFGLSSEYLVHKAYSTFTVGKYTVTTLPAVHMGSDSCFMYLIREDDKYLLYATDTGYFSKDVLDYFVENHIRLDAMIVDGTYGLVRCMDKEHMDFFENEDLRQHLLSLGVIDLNTKCFITHLFHGAAKDLNALEKAVPLGYILPYDGYEFTL